MYLEYTNLMIESIVAWSTWCVEEQDYSFSNGKGYSIDGNVDFTTEQGFTGDGQHRSWVNDVFRYLKEAEMKDPDQFGSNAPEVVELSHVRALLKASNTAATMGYTAGFILNRGVSIEQHRIEQFQKTQSLIDDLSQDDLLGMLAEINGTNKLASEQTPETILIDRSDGDETMLEQLYSRAEVGFESGNIEEMQNTILTLTAYIGRRATDRADTFGWTVPGSSSTDTPTKVTK